MLSTIEFPSEEFHVKVVAKLATAPEDGKKGKSVDANTSGKSGSKDNEFIKGKDSTSQKKSKFSIFGIVGIVVGAAFLAAIILVFLLRRRRQG